MSLAVEVRKIGTDARLLVSECGSMNYYSRVRLPRTTMLVIARICVHREAASNGITMESLMRFAKACSPFPSAHGRMNDADPSRLSGGTGGP